jgi:cytochrome oxidase assembly protein ShyY1
MSKVWRVALLGSALLAAETGLLALAHWQWQRYHQRLAQVAEFQSRPPQTLSGTWQAQVVALTNQPSPLNPEQTTGWRVFSPILTSAGVVVVDRGFTPSPSQPIATAMAALTPAAVSVTLQGVWQPFPQRRGWLRGPDVTTHPQLLAFLNPALLTSTSVGPNYFIASTQSHPQLQPSPPPLPNPQRHLSYALQWLGMALALPMLALSAWLKARRRRSA